MAEGDQMHGDDKEAMRREAAARSLGTVSNLTKATAVGVTVGPTAAIVISWLAAEAETRYGVPTAVTAGVLGTGATWFMRWAAKLLPHV